MEHKDIGKRIHARRLEIDISAAELADRLHMAKATIHRYENGEIKNIKLPVIEAIARELKCNPAWLVGKSDRKETGTDANGNIRYNDVIKLLDDLIQFVGYTENMTCNGNRIDKSDRMAVIAGFRTIREMTLSRYK